MTLPPDLTHQLRTLGLSPGPVVVVHTAFSKVAPLAGGPSAFIDALLSVLGPRGTLVMPTMSAGDAPFDPATTLCAPASGCGDCEAARANIGRPLPSVPAVWV